MIAEICRTKEGRNLSIRRLEGKIGVSATTAWRMLRKNGFRTLKESTKPGLTEAIKEAWLAFCKAHEHWTLEDWKKVI
jgi:hypothetical protein